MGSGVVDISSARIDRAREDAAHWLERMETRPLTEEEQRTFDRWHGASKMNRKAMAEIECLTGITSALQNHVTAGDRAAGVKPRLWERKDFGRRHLAVAGIAASLIAVILATFLSALPGERDQRAIYNTAVGGQELIQLPDGSNMHLNTSTHAEILFTDAERRILLTRGEAHFDVRKDSRRPFIVLAGDRSVEAVGTIFTVSLERGQVEVTVAEGKVNVHQESREQTQKFPQHQVGTRPLLASLRENERALISEGRREITVLSESELARELAWRDGTLVFAGEELTEVLAEVSRYSDDEFVIEDPALRELRFGGLFRVGNTQALLEALRVGYGIESSRDDQQRVVLSWSDGRAVPSDG